MKIAYITAGAAGMYCGTCMHDNTLAAALMERGHEVSLTPTYTPMRTDETSVANDQIFFGAVNVYLQQKLSFFRYTPGFLDRLLDNRRLLRFVSRFSASTNAHDLGALTWSMLEGENGLQKKELEKLVLWLEEILQPDIVHLSHSLFAGFARQIKQRLGVPVVASLSGEDLFFDELEEPWYSRVRQTLAERALDIDAFTAPNRYYAEAMSQNFAIPAERIHLTRLGIRAEDFSQEPPPRPDGSPVVIGCLARFSPEKGIHQLLDAFQLLHQQLPAGSVRLRIAGYLGNKDRDYYELQRQRVSDWGLDAHIDFVGEVDRQQKIDFLHSLDVFSLPTVYLESKGLPILEALASGVPVVQPRHGAFPEWVEQTGGGLLVKPGSATALAQGLRQLVEDGALRQQLRLAGRQAALQDFNEEVMADEVLSLYYQLVAPVSATSVGGP